MSLFYKKSHGDPDESTRLKIISLGNNRGIINWLHDASLRIILGRFFTRE